MSEKLNLLNMKNPVNRLRGSSIITMRGGFVTPLLKTEGMKHQCCMCRRVKREDGTWSHALVSGEISHGFCPPCYHRERVKIFS